MYFSQEVHSGMNPSTYLLVNLQLFTDWLSVSVNSLETEPTISKLRNIGQRWHEFSSPLAIHMHYKMVWMKGCILCAHSQQTLQTKEKIF